MITVLVFLGTILVLVGAHEIGHLLAAKRLGVYVHEFSIGFGPPLISFRRGETRWSVRAIPFGGYIRLAGEDRRETGTDIPPSRILYNKPPLVRAAISLSGPVANLLLTFAIAVFSLWVVGTPLLQVADVIPGEPASAVLRPGDRVLAIAGRAVARGEDVSRLVQGSAGGSVEFRIKREGRIEVVRILPAFDVQAGRYRVGAYFLPVAYTNEILKLEASAPLRLAGLRAGDRVVAVNAERIETAVRLLDLLAAAPPGDPLTLTVSRASAELDVRIAGGADRAGLLDGATFADLGVDRRRAGPIGGLVLGAQQMGEDLRLIGESLRGLLTGRLAARDAVAGPVGMAYLLGQSVSAGASAFLRLLSLLSLSLGLFNLIPFPALDGSRAAFAFYEAVRRKPIPPEREGVVHAIGFVILIALLLLVTYQDLVRLFG